MIPIIPVIPVIPMIPVILVIPMIPVIPVTPMIPMRIVFTAPSLGNKMYLGVVAKNLIFLAFFVTFFSQAIYSIYIVIVFVISF